ncbi:MAG: nucleoside triphosphate hydrolase [Chlamydiae bacterium CG10_big_fil_rev_8_21_14_0_10_42_34]|nr:MAG: nucleoside triphosphate hydrolase [Chlamydiae bacterium CG10_big_fil_rev_8_21_14_0_10_42_34]
MERQFTATAYVFHDNQVLLHKHAKLGKWLPPGGHVEANETPPEAAIREVKEETGLDIEFIEQENLKINGYNAVSMQRPFLCLLENIPEHKGVAAHEHMDFVYLAKPLELKDELNGFRWFRYEELLELDLFPDVQEVLRLLLKENGLEALQAQAPLS